MNDPCPDCEHDPCRCDYCPDCGHHLDHCDCCTPATCECGYVYCRCLEPEDEP